MSSRNMNIQKNIAFVATENKKTDLIEWSYFNKELLLPHKVIATGNAGNILEGTLNKTVSKLSAAAFGGYQELSAKIEAGKVDVIIFFGDAEELQLNNNDFDSLMDTALSHNIIIAKNKATADFVLTSVLMQKKYPVTAGAVALKTI
ncbi:methylglyoxal synthase [soil metagenome]